jgi:hypothetical protein
MNLFSLSADIQLDDNAFLAGLRQAGDAGDKFAGDCQSPLHRKTALF